MNREIKFRFWSGEKMFYDNKIALECLMQQTGGIYDHIGLHNAVFMQFTGLHDKNGKEIYEGDIVKNISSLIHWHDDGEILEVEILPSGVKPCAEYDSDCGEYSSGEDWEVIGNIYENPELSR